MSIMDELDKMLVGRKPGQNETTRVSVGNITIGGPQIPLVAGPCAVESYEQLRQIADTLNALGLPIMRGGAFKPRTSPYKFQGLGQIGLELLGRIREEAGLAVISEVMSIAQLEQAAPYIDCFQIGARNMQNFELLRALGRMDKPVLLKRGLSATLDELLYAAEYILTGGNPNVILCERGVRSFDVNTRNLVDLAGVALLKEWTHLPVIVDPSHGTGKRSLIAPICRAAIAAGADGLIVETHPQPDASYSDPEQAISLEALANLVPSLQRVAEAVDRGLLLQKTSYPLPTQASSGQ